MPSDDLAVGNRAARAYIPTRTTAETVRVPSYRRREWFPVKPPTQNQGWLQILHGLDVESHLSWRASLVSWSLGVWSLPGYRKRHSFCQLLQLRVNTPLC